MRPPGKSALDVFYPIVPDQVWMARIAPLGIKLVQLRLKDASTSEVRAQVRACLELARQYGIQLIVNDYWEAAIDAGADFIHLGQEDLADADMKAVRKAQIRFGVSTHDEAELETALGFSPEYVALGPIYETKLKVMKWQPQGLDRLRAWRRRIGDLPLVAIGGLTPDRANGVIEAGASSLAVITDFVTHRDPERRIATWLEWAISVRKPTGLVR